MRTLISVFLLCLLANRDVCAQLVVPDKAIQTQIERTAKAFSEAFSRAPQREKSVILFYTELGKLHVLANNDEKHFVQQLFYYSATKNIDDEAWSLYMKHVLPIRVLGISKRTIAEAVVPFLDAEDERIALSVSSWLKVIDGPPHSAGGECLYDFSPYRSLISPHKPQRALVRYLYYRAPSSALLLMAEIYGHGEKNAFRDLRWADHVVQTAIWEIRNGFADRSNSANRAIRQLEILSRRREWWIRLYVAAILARYRVFRTDELTQRLQKDHHPLVQEFVHHPVLGR